MASWPATQFHKSHFLCILRKEVEYVCECGRQFSLSAIQKRHFNVHVSGELFIFWGIWSYSALFLVTMSISS